MLILRIVSTVISAIFIAAVIPVGALVNWLWAGICALCAFLFYGLMLLFKQKQESAEKTEDAEDAEDTEAVETVEKAEAIEENDSEGK